MDAEFDRNIKERLLQGAAPLPETYHQRLDDVLNDLPKGGGTRRVQTRLRYAFVAVLVLLLGSSIAYAGVSLYQQRLEGMDSGTKKSLNEKTQKSEAQADSYSRDLSSVEQKRMEKLHTEYEKEGRFPTGQLMEVIRKEQVIQVTLCYCYENSTFYLPDDVLSDEELLQIIDFREKRDYSIQSANKTQTSTVKEEANACISKEEAVEVAKECVSTLDGANMENVQIQTEFNHAGDSSDMKGTGSIKAETKGSNEKMSSYIISLKNTAWPNDYQVEVDASDASVMGIWTDNKKKEERSFQIKIRERRYIKRENEISDYLNKMGVSELIEQLEFSYKYTKAGMLSQGTVKYIAKLKNGQAYVLVYSENAKMVFECYQCDYDFVKRIARNNKKRDESMGILLKNVVIKR